MRRRLTGAAAACAATALILGGCGESDEDQIAQTVESYFDALAAHEFPSACELTAPEFRERLASYAEEGLDLQTDDCAAILTRLVEVNGRELVALQAMVEAGEVEVEGATATAELSGPGQTAELVREDGEWRVSELDFSGAAGG